MLQHRGHIASGKDVAGQEQNRHAIDRRGRRTGDHIGRAGADGGGADQGAQAVGMFGKGRGGMYHRLLVACLIIAEVGVLVERLSQAGDVAVPKDAKTARKEALFHAVAFAVLVLQKAHDRLCYRQADGGWVTHGSASFFPLVVFAHLLDKVRSFALSCIMMCMMYAVTLVDQREHLMVTPALLESVRTLSIPDKVALIQAVSQMLQRELQNPLHINGHAKVDSLPAQEKTPLPAHLKVGNQDMKALVAELLSRPDPTPDQMLPRGLLQGLQFDEEDFRAAEWHPSAKELLGE